MSSRTILAVRLSLVAVIVAGVLLAARWRYAIPLWLPFLVAVALEVEFAVGGLLQLGRQAPRERGRAPQRADLERFGGDGEPPDDEDPEFWASAPVPRPWTSLLRRVAVSAAVVAFVALVAWGISVRRGWSSLDHGTQLRVEQVLSREAVRIAGHPADVRCDTAGDHVGAVQEADGVAQVGGRDAWLTPVDPLPALPRDRPP